MSHHNRHLHLWKSLLWKKQRRKRSQPFRRRFLRKGLKLN
uniref:Uncharacterized protein n=1 Tax=Parascaris equorum TaxID=6256 RepID=A0A914R793_PAREQ